MNDNSATQMPTPGRTATPGEQVDSKATNSTQPRSTNNKQGGIDGPGSNNGHNNSDLQCWYRTMINIFGVCVGTLGAIPCCFCLPNRYKTIHPDELGLVVKFGRCEKEPKGPGLVKVNPFSEELIRVDTKIQTVNVHDLTVITKDAYALSVSAAVYYHVIDAYKATFVNNNLPEILCESARAQLPVAVSKLLHNEVIQKTVYRERRLWQCASNCKGMEMRGQAGWSNSQGDHL